MYTEKATCDSGLSFGNSYNFLRPSMVSAMARWHKQEMYEKVAATCDLKNNNPKQLKRGVLGYLGLNQPHEAEIDSTNIEEFNNFVSKIDPKQVIWIPVDSMSGGHKPKKLTQEGRLPPDVNGRVRLMQKAQSSDRKPFRLVWDENQVVVEIGELGASAGATFEGKDLNKGEIAPKITSRSVCKVGSLPDDLALPKFGSVHEKVLDFMRLTGMTSFGLEGYLREQEDVDDEIFVDCDFPKVDWEIR